MQSPLATAEPTTGEIEAPFHMVACGCSACHGLRTDSAGDGAAGLTAIKPTWSLQQVIANYTRSGDAWRTSAPIPFAFREASPPGADEAFVAFTETERQMTRMAFELISDVVNLRFVEQPDDYRSTSGGNKIYLGAASDIEEGVWGYASRFERGVSLYSAEIWTSTAAVAVRQWFPGGYNFQALLHEIVHALGVPHPGDYNAGGEQDVTFQQHAAFAQDTRQYSIMSYFDAELSGADYLADFADGRFSPATPMLHDIAGLQAIYGANQSTRAGDTVYGYNSTAGRVSYDFAALRPDGTPAPKIFTIWDAGGVDTIDFSLSPQRVNLDLRAGFWSDAFEMVNNIAIAYGVTIENGVGGAAGDTLRGNDAHNRLEGRGGDDALEGAGGADLLFGGEGADRFVFAAASDSTSREGVDVVGDFESGKDRLDFSRMADLRVISINALESGGAVVFAQTDAGQLTLAVTGRIEGDDVLHAPALGAAFGYDLVGLNGPDDTLVGSNGGDRIFGLAGHDRLEGGAGDDQLFGDFGADLLFGGAGSDRFAYRAATDSNAQQGTDIIADFTAGDRIDLFYLDRVTAVSVNRLGSGTYLFAATAAGVLQVGLTSAINGADVVAPVTARPGFGFDVVGEAGRDTLVGSAGDDRLFGEAGDDHLQGGGGGDLLYGRAGADVFVYSAASDSPQGGFDSVFGFEPGVDQLDLRAARTGAADTYAWVERLGSTLVFVDLGGDGTADMMINLQDTVGLRAADVLW